MNSLWRLRGGAVGFVGLHRVLVGGSCVKWVRAASDFKHFLRSGMDSGEMRQGAAVSLYWARGGHSKFARCRRRSLRALCGDWALLRQARRACDQIWQGIAQSSLSCKLQRSRVYFHVCLCEAARGPRSLFTTPTSSRIDVGLVPAGARTHTFRHQVGSRSGRANTIYCSAAARARSHL